MTEAVDLLGYLYEKAGELDFYFTLEDKWNPESGRLRVYRLEIMPDPDITSIDALVAMLDDKLEEYQVVRSTEHPSVIHLIANDLPQEDYLLEEVVSVEYNG